MHAVKAFPKEAFVRYMNHTVPKAQHTISPIAIETMQQENFFGSLSVRSPVHRATKTYPIIYPPVGPIRMPAPELNPENTGSPIRPRRTYTIWLKAPYLAPKIEPHKNTPKVAKFIGTGVKGIGRAI